LAASAVVWCIHRVWFPVVSAAVQQLPDRGALHAGQFDWTGNSPRMLAESRFLALTVDLQHEGEARSPAHLQVEFGRRDFRVLSLFGFVSGAYPQDWFIPLTRSELEPWWGAWAPALLGLAWLMVVAGLMLVWMLLAAVYCGAPWLVGFFANRDVTWSGSWRLAGASQMPGALLMTIAIALYGFGLLDPLRSLLVFALHVAVSWVYLLAAPFWLPRHPDAASARSNPFNDERPGPIRH
jgi:hypothetical protein